MRNQEGAAALDADRGGAQSTQHRPVCPSRSLRARFAAATMWSFAGAVISRGVGLVAAIWAARLLGPSSYGALGVLTATSALVSTLTSMGFGVALSNSVAAHRERSPATASAAIRQAQSWALCLGSVGGLVMLGLAQTISERIIGAGDAVTAVRWAALFVPASAIATTQAGALAGLESFRQLAYVNATRGLVLAGLTVAGAHFFGLQGAAFALAASEIVVSVYSAQLIARERRQKLLTTGTPARGVRRGLLRVALPTIAGGAATTVALWLARVWLATSTGGLVEVGRFEAANKWALAVLFFPSVVSSVQLPLLSHTHGTGDRRGYRNLLTTQIFVVCAACAVPGITIAVYARELMELSGPAFAAGTSALRVLSIATVVTALNTALGQALISRGRSAQRLVADLVLAATLMVGAWLLVGRYGALGFAWANALAYAVACCVLAMFAGWKQTNEALNPTYANETRQI